MRGRLVVVVIGALAALGGCGSGQPAQGGLRQSCYPNGTCNVGLTCLSKVCVDASSDAAAGTNGAAGASGAAGGGAAGAGIAGGDGRAGAAGGAGVRGSGGGSGAGVADGGANDATDAGAETTPEAGTSDGGFDVLSLPNLVMWLDASKGVATATGSGGTNLVMFWRDQSPAFNTPPPSGQAPEWLPTAINGLPAVEFVGIARLISNTNGTTLDLGAGEYLVEMVAAWATTSSSSALLFQLRAPTAYVPFTLREDATSHGVVGSELATYVSPSVTSTATGLGDGAFRLIGARRVGANAAASLEVRVNGAASAMTTDNGVGGDLGTSAYVQIGPGNNLEIAELVVIRGATSPDDLGRLETYLLSKYGLK
jgi:hypothetical protein